MQVYLRTFGCRANHYDSEAARAMIEGAGHTVVSRAADADIAVFNSCAVTGEAEADLRQAIRRASRERPELRSIVMGCASALSERPGARSLRSLPTVEHLVVGADMPSLADALGLPPSSAVVRATRQTGTRALLRIQDGCDEHCTFCATTLARGANRSRTLNEVVEEAKVLAERHPEIVLTGIHIGTYGRDIGLSLGTLLQRLVDEVPDVRFRLSSVEVTELDAALRDLLTGDPRRVTPYLHAPLQSGSDRVLKRMGRHWYTAERYAVGVQHLVRDRRVFGLGADVIAGFPGETEDDHRQTMDLIERLPFTYLHVFPFSPRPGAAAERLTGRLPADVVGRRARELRELGDWKAGTYRTARATGIADVVIEGSRSGERQGVTEDYLTVWPSDASLPRGARFSARLSLRGDRLAADPLISSP